MVQKRYSPTRSTLNNVARLLRIAVNAEWSGDEPGLKQSFLRKAFAGGLATKHETNIELLNAVAVE
ncbi:MAG: hypothetical protein IIA66_09150 [Planctomycetes bacterium]|nr:hypothetical protein [Planctomycetota bacterium]